MCNKIKARIECLKHGYPASEAMVSDNEPEFPCDIPMDVLLLYRNKKLKEYCGDEYAMETV